MNVKIRILNEVHAAVLGLTQEHQDYFYDKYAVHAKNYFFNPKFKLGRWDGKIRFFQKTGKTYLYLLEDIVPRISNLGYKIQVDDLRTSNVVFPEPVTTELFAGQLHPDSGMPILLRDYQVDAVNSVLPYSNGVIVASTGAGKTIICASLCQSYGVHGVKTLTIVPSQDLIQQTKKMYIACGLDTGEYSGNEKNLEPQHVISTWQALQHNLPVVSRFNMVIVDECHGLSGNVLTKIITENANSITYRFGVTGTIPKEDADALAVHTAIGPVRVEIPAEKLINEGHLATIQIDMFELEEEFTEKYNQYLQEYADAPFKDTDRPLTYRQFKDQYFPDFTTEKSYLQKNLSRIEWISYLLEAKRDEAKGNVLCLVDSIPFGRKLAAMIPGAHFVNGQDMKKTTERRKIYDLFKEHDDLIVIATVNIAGTGLDVPRIFNLVFIDVGKSFVRVIQGIGRGLRKAADKDSVTVTDIHSDLKYGRKHAKERIKYYKEAKYPFKKYTINYMQQLA